MYCSICWNPVGERGSVSETGEPSVKKAKLEQKNLCCTPCGHLYHKSCLQSWFQSKGNAKGGTCPKCRNHVKINKLYPVFPDFEEVDKDNYDNSEIEAESEDDAEAETESEDDAEAETESEDEAETETEPEDEAAELEASCEPEPIISIIDSSSDDEIEEV